MLHLCCMRDVLCPASVDAFANLSCVKRVKGSKADPSMTNIYDKDNEECTLARDDYKQPFSLPLIVFLLLLLLLLF